MTKCRQWNARIQLINAVAPFIINARLKPLMLRTPERDKHIRQCVRGRRPILPAQETIRHPHTNMAKARSYDARTAQRLSRRWHSHEQRGYRMGDGRRYRGNRGAENRRAAAFTRRSISWTARRASSDPIIDGLNTGETRMGTIFGRIYRPQTGKKASLSNRNDRRHCRCRANRRRSFHQRVFLV